MIVRLHIHKKNKMTKLTKQDLPPKGQRFYYCEICKQFVPWKDKHNKKHHKEIK